MSSRLSSVEKQVQEYLAQLADETDGVRKSAFFKECLDTMAKFWKYSYRNQLLIHAQNRNASLVAGFRKWNELGRRVKAGSKAIKILAPFSKKEKQKDQSTGEEVEVSRTYFWPVNVFDVSQTEGKELPSLDVEVSGSDLQWLLDGLLGFCKAQSISVEFKELGVNGLYGYSKNGKIAVSSKQSVNSQVNTLLHEIAHELIHYSEEGLKFSKEEKEIQAEATAYVISKALGFENKAANYLALYTDDKEKIMQNLKIISEASKKILTFLEGNRLVQNNAHTQQTLGGVLL